MAVINRNSLVLLGVSVVSDVVTGTMDNGIYAVTRRTTAIPFPKRRPSHRFPQAMQEPGQRQCLADEVGVDSCATGAGRPGSYSCVLATHAGPRGWSLAGARSSLNTRLRRSRLAAWQSRISGDRSQWRLAGSCREAFRSIAANANKREGSRLAWLKPAGGAPLASTRG
jgi:hypothetical protein